MKDILIFDFNTAPGEEIKRAFSRTKHALFSKGSSLKGRGVCLLLIPAHTTGFVFKPLMYIAFTGASLFFTVFFADDKKYAFVATSKLAATAIVSPIGQAAKVIQATVGIIHPGAYFKNASSENNSEDLPDLPGGTKTKENDTEQSLQLKEAIDILEQLARETHTPLLLSRIADLHTMVNDTLESEENKNKYTQYILDLARGLNSKTLSQHEKTTILTHFSSQSFHLNKEQLQNACLHLFCCQLEKEAKKMGISFVNDIALLYNRIINGSISYQKICCCDLLQKIAKKFLESDFPEDRKRAVFAIMDPGRGTAGIGGCMEGVIMTLNRVRGLLDFPTKRSQLLPYLADQYKHECLVHAVAINKRFNTLHATSKLIDDIGEEIGLSRSMIEEARTDKWRLDVENYGYERDAYIPDFVKACTREGFLDSLHTFFLTSVGKHHLPDISHELVINKLEQITDEEIDELVKYYGITFEDWEYNEHGYCFQYFYSADRDDPQCFEVNDQALLDYAASLSESNPFQYFDRRAESDKRNGRIASAHE